MSVSDIQPAWNTTTLSKSDSATFATTRAVLVIVGGAVKVGYPDGTTDTFTNLAAGWHPLRINMLYSTGTDAGVEMHGAY